MGETCSIHEHDDKGTKVAACKPEGRRSLENNNIKADLKERVCDTINWIYLTRNTIQWWSLANIIIKPRVSEGRAVSWKLSKC
jgi:hypothetical protein